MNDNHCSNCDALLKDVDITALSTDERMRDLCRGCNERKYSARWIAFNSATKVNRYPAPKRAWRTMAILSVILFMTACVGAYYLITNLI